MTMPEMRSTSPERLATLLVVFVAAALLGAPASASEGDRERMPSEQPPIPVETEVPGMEQVSVESEVVTRTDPASGEVVETVRVRQVFEPSSVGPGEQAGSRCWTDHEVWPIRKYGWGGGAYIQGKANVQTSCSSATFQHYLAMWETPRGMGDHQVHVWHRLRK